MSGNLWTAPTQQRMVGTSIAQNTFTAARDIPCGENATSFPIIYGGSLNPGDLINVKGWGVMSNTGTPTIILGLYYGLVAGTNLVISTAKTTTTAMTNWQFSFEYHMRVISTGTTGSVIGYGKWYLPTSLTAETTIKWPETAPAAVTIDTTTNKLLSLGATWSASSASNTLTLHDMEVLTSG